MGNFVSACARAFRLVLFGGIALLFPWRTTNTFVAEGWPCAALELMIVIPVVVIYWLLTRRGAVFISAGFGAILTSLAVFLALMPVQFQCMFQQAPHLLVWHLGMAVLLMRIDGVKVSGDLASGGAHIRLTFPSRGGPRNWSMRID